MRTILRTLVHAVATSVIWLFKLAETFFNWITTVEPRILSRICVGLLIILAVLTCVLNDKWMDRISAFGFWITFIGFWYTLYQLAYTQNLAERSRQEYMAGASNQRGQFYRHCLNFARDWIIQADGHITVRQWPLACGRISDVQGMLLHIQNMRDHVNSRFSEQSENLIPWRGIFQTGKIGKPLQYNPNDWHMQVHAIRTILTEELGDSAFQE
jgi:hypothetical protein